MEEEDEESKVSNRQLSFIRQCQTCCWIIYLSIAVGFIQDHLNLNWWFHITTYYGHNFVEGILKIGELLGALLCGFLLYGLGRRKIVILTNALIILVVIGYITSIPDLITITTMILDRISQQFFIISMTIYVAEIASPLMRPMLIGFHYVGKHIGHLISNLMINWPNTSTALVLIMTINSLSMSLLYASETPYWLALAGASDEGEDLFVYLRAGYSDMDEANIMLEQAEKDAKARQQGLLHNMRSSRIFVPFIVFEFMLMANLIVIHMVNPILLELRFTHPTDYIKFFGYDDIWKLTMDNRMEIILSLIGSVLYLALCPIIPQRLLYVSSIVSSLLILFSYFLASNDASLSIYMISCCHLLAYMGSFQVLQTILIEIFPSSTREFSVMICQVQIILVLIIGEWPTLTEFSSWYENIAIKIRWFFFPLGLFFTILLMPETKGLTLAEAEEKVHHVFFTRKRVAREAQ